ncbi:hypothetical protein V2G26_009565 [Clonostachys chloroleuca]
MNAPVVIVIVNMHFPTRVAALSDFAEIGGDGCPAGYFHIPRALFVPSLLSRTGIQLSLGEKKKGTMELPGSVAHRIFAEQRPTRQNQHIRTQHGTATGVVTKANGLARRVCPGRGRTRGSRLKH